MEEKKITKAEFDKAVAAVTEKMANNDKLEGMSKFIVTLTGTMFAREMRDILFPEDETEGSEERV